MEEQITSLNAMGSQTTRPMLDGHFIGPTADEAMADTVKHDRLHRANKSLAFTGFFGPLFD
jgi:hypothetical protein